MSESTSNQNTTTIARKNPGDLADLRVDNQPSHADLLSPHNPWPHRLAVLLVVMTFPLIWVGGLVTSYKAGMAVYDWPNTFGYNMLLFPIARWLRGSFDLFIEHGHRLLATLVGCLSIALVFVTYRGETRTWVKRFSLLILALVIGQGVLGGLRVLVDQQQLALIHGCVANLFFACTVAMAVVTSVYWRRPATTTEQRTSSGLCRLAWTTCLIAYAQIVIGAHVRHVSVTTSAGSFQAAVFFHLIMAAILTLLIFSLSGQIVVRHYGLPRLRRPSLILLALVFVQVALGGASWVLKYSWPEFMSQYQFAAMHTVTAQGFLQGVVVTAHVATGSLIFVFSLIVSLRTTRLMQPSPSTSIVGAVA